MFNVYYPLKKQAGKILQENSFLLHLSRRKRKGKERLHNIYVNNSKITYEIYCDPTKLEITIHAAKFENKSDRF